jgi:hypothetical protein
MTFWQDIRYTGRLLFKDRVGSETGVGRSARTRLPPETSPPLTRGVMCSCPCRRRGGRCARLAPDTLGYDASASAFFPVVSIRPCTVAPSAMLIDGAAASPSSEAVSCRTILLLA